MADPSRREFLRCSAAASLSGCLAAAASTQEPVPTTPLQGDCLDAALRRLAGTGPSYGPGFANHGPMAAEALVAIGRPDAVAGFLDRYQPALERAPAAGEPLAAAELAVALGDATAFPRLEATVAGELAAQPWRDVLRRWSDRLLPGLMGALAHGVIRTAHAARALGARDTDERRRELARALAYWASTHRPALGAPGAGRESASAALRRVPLLPTAHRRLTQGPSERRLAEVMAHRPFVDAVADAGPVDAAAFTAELLETAAHLLVQNGREAPIFFVHAVTAVAAVDSLLPLLAEPSRSLAAGHAWRFAAAIQSRFGNAPFRGDEVAAPPGGIDERVERAVQHGDEHVIKLTVACALAWRAAPRPALLAAADRVVDLL